MAYPQVMETETDTRWLKWCDWCHDLTESHDTSLRACLDCGTTRDTEN